MAVTLVGPRKLPRTCSTASSTSSGDILRVLPLSERGLGFTVVMPSFLYREYQVWMVRQVNWKRCPSSSRNICSLT